MANLWDDATSPYTGQGQPSDQWTDMPRDEVVRRGVIGGQIPLYGLLGAIGLGGAAGTLDPNTGQGPQ
jgi:hypothetical protein